MHHPSFTVWFGTCLWLPSMCVHLEGNLGLSWDLVANVPGKTLGVQWPWGPLGPLYCMSRFPLQGKINAGCIYGRVMLTVPHWWVLQPSLHSQSVGNSVPATLSPSCPSGLICSATAGKESLAFIRRVSKAVRAFQKDLWFVITLVIMPHHNISTPSFGRLLHAIKSNCLNLCTLPKIE